MNQPDRSSPIRLSPARTSARLWRAGLAACALVACMPLAAQFKNQPAPLAPEQAEQVLAEVFGQPITAARLQWNPAEPRAAADRLRGLVLRQALERFITEQRLQATDADVATYRKWEREFGRVERERRAQQLVQLDEQLKRTDLSPQARQKIEAGRAALVRMEQLSTPPSAAKGKGADADMQDRALRVWIEGHKARAAMYQRYKGRVGLTAMGPDPVGATEALLREHEQAGRLVIRNPALAQAFWEGFLREPRQPAAPEQIDFTLYWTRPPGPTPQTPEKK